MVDSILQREKRCYICHREGDLHRHHVYGGGSRQAADKAGFTVWLCPEHHTVGDYAVHNNKAIDIELKQKCQAEYEKSHSREEFRAIIGRSYL